MNTAFPLVLTIDGGGTFTLYFRSAEDRDSVRGDLSVGVTLYTTENHGGPTGLAMQTANEDPDAPVVVVEFASQIERDNFARDMAGEREIAAWYTPEPPESTDYMFDMAGVATIMISTAHGEAAARQAAASAAEFRPGSADADPSAAEFRPGSADADPSAPDVLFQLIAVAPRGKAYLAEANPEPDNGSDTSITDPAIPEPIDGENRDYLKSELADAVEALEGDSNDAEHDALRSLAEAVAGVLGVEFGPRDPGDYDEGEEDEETGKAENYQDGPCGDQ